MLKRTISAIVLCAICIPALIVGGNIFSILVFLVSFMALYEIMDIKETKKSLPILMKVVAYLMLAVIYVMSLNNSEFVISYKIISSLILSMMLPLIFYKRESYSINDAMYLIGFVFLISTSFSLIVYIRNMSNDWHYLMYVLLIAIFTDTFAYIGGNLIGSHKLIPSISPNKTIEGTIVGLIVGTLIASTYYYITINDTINVIYLIGCTLFLSVLGQLGDLVFSTIKRYFGKKDYSNLIPGHGGILDRFDSLIFIVYGFILLIGIL